MPSGIAGTRLGVLGARLFSGAFLAAQAAAIVLFGFILPPDSPFLPRCVFHALTGLHCPGCGTGRGLRLILRGDILAGLGQNWLLLAGIPLLALADVNAALAVLGKKPLFDPERIRGAALPALALIVAYWILRNLPFFPFTLLAPRPA